MPAPRSLPSYPRITLLVGLLAATVLFASLLAYEAHVAARAERVTAERALREYASVAAWELRSAATDRLQELLGRTLGSVTRSTGASPFESIPGVDALRGAVERELACGDSSREAQAAFRLDLRDGAMATLPSGLAEARVAPLVGAARRAVRELATPERPLGLLVAPGQPDVAFGVRYARLGAPVAVYGATVCARELAARLFAEVVARHPLAPLAVNGPRNDTLFVVAVLAAPGDTIFANGGEAPPRHTAEVALDTWGSWRALVAIRAGAAEQLLAGAPQRSRVPLLLALLVMTAALGVVALLQIRREHELARLRADFTSSVSHELRTPLAQILLFGETLSLGRARTEAERRLAADTIVQEARRLMHLVDSVLLFARGRRPGRDHRPVPVDVSRVVQDVAASFAPLAQAAGVALEVDATGAPAVQGDPGAIRQILLNLLDNAVKYGPRGQTVRVAAHATGGRVRLVVDDEGPGVDPTDRERIWSPYVRLRREPAARGGSGIGLAVVRELAESLGGSAWVETAPGGGARFVVDLQATGALPGAAPAGPGAPGDPRPRAAARRPAAPMSSSRSPSDP
jgi:signal transduction histidine kinase